LVPLIFGEQLYRAFTIIKGEKYHHGWVENYELKITNYE
jgi:hypothetical protein